MRKFHIAVAALLLLAGCHDRRTDVTTPSGDGVKQQGKSGLMIIFCPKNLPAVVTQILLENGDIRKTIFRQLEPTSPSHSSVRTSSRVVEAC